MERVLPLQYPAEPHDWWSAAPDYRHFTYIKMYHHPHPPQCKFHFNYAWTRTYNASY